MGYDRIFWEDSPSSTTPISAENLNHMEEGIEAATNGVTTNEEAIKKLQTEVSNKANYTDTNIALSGKLSDTKGSVKTSNLADSSVTTEKINNGSITLEKLAQAVLDLINEKEILSNKISDRTHITDTEENYPSIEYLNGYYYNYEEVDDLLGEKLDSSNIVSGTCDLTPDTTTLAKSGTCTYIKIGNMVFINAKLTFTSQSTAGITAKYARFGNLPYATSNDYNSGNNIFLTDLKNTGQFYFRWNRIVATPDTVLPADDETTNISFFYMINS